MTAPETDLCAHGKMRILLNDECLLETPDNHALNGVALCLLRTVARDHTPAAPVCDALAPHCAFQFIYGWPTMMNSGLLGCPANQDFEVVHVADEVHLRFWDGGVATVGGTSWLRAVLDFSTAVRSLYETAPEKQPSDLDAAGFRGFMAEWESLQHEAERTSRRTDGHSS